MHIESTRKNKFIPHCNLFPCVNASQTWLLCKCKMWLKILRVSLRNPHTVETSPSAQLCLPWALHISKNLHNFGCSDDFLLISIKLHKKWFNDHLNWSIDKNWINLTYNEMEKVWGHYDRFAVINVPYFVSTTFGTFFVIILKTSFIDFSRFCSRKRAGPCSGKWYCLFQNYPIG